MSTFTVKKAPGQPPWRRASEPVKLTPVAAFFLAGDGRSNAQQASILMSTCKMHQLLYVEYLIFRRPVDVSGDGVLQCSD